MARKEVHFPRSIWEDLGFIQLGWDAQRLFFLVYSQPELDAAGVLPLRPSRWSRCAAGDTREGVNSHLDALNAAGWLAVDRNTEEVYVPRFFEWERIGSQPRRAVAALDALGGCHSPRLRALAMADLMGEVQAAVPCVPRGVRAEILLRDGNQCRGCGWSPGDPAPERNGRPVHRGLELDHIYPKSKGGSDDPGNLQVLCTSCNSSKGARV